MQDAEGRNVFQGGFLGLDNIGVFDRSAPLPPGMRLDQADGTAWMAMYCLNMLALALELAVNDPTYEDVATKFFEHFIYIGNALNRLGLWNEEAGFYFDNFFDGHRTRPVQVFSFVGLIPLFAVETMDSATLERLPNFRRRMQWFLKYRPYLTDCLATLEPNAGGRWLLSVVPREHMSRILSRVLDEDQFLSAFGLRGLSRYHAQHPFELAVDGSRHCIGYEPAESRSALFGGNSNWRGPIWMPVNYLMVESLQKFALYYQDTLTVPLRVGGVESRVTLQAAALEIARRVATLFLPRPGDGGRPLHGRRQWQSHDPHFRDLVLFYEYFNGDTGEGLGASHQTGWTVLVSNLLLKLSRAHSCSDDMHGSST